MKSHAFDMAKLPRPGIYRAPTELSWPSFVPSAVLVLAIIFLFQPPIHASVGLTNCTEANIIAAIKSGGRVSIACDATIAISQTLVISKNLTLDAAGHDFTINGSNSNRIFVVNRGVNLTLVGITLRNGRHGDDSTNSVSGASGFGGAILNDGGTVVLENCTFSDHRAVGSPGVDGAPSLFGNGDNADDGGSGRGGAIFNNGGVLLINNSSFIGNSASGGLGGDGGGGSPSGNGGHGGNGGDGGAGIGGAIFNTADGVVEVFDSTFSSNRVAGAVGGFEGAGGGALGLAGSFGAAGISGGGAIFSEGGRLKLNNCTFVANTCVGVTGISGVVGTGARKGGAGQNGSSALGAALFNDGGALAITNATFFANVLVAGNAGLGGDGSSSGFGSDGGDGGDGGLAKGGALYNRNNGTAAAVNCTFSNNSAVGGTGAAGGRGGGFTGRNGRSGQDSLGSGGGIFNEMGTVILKNTILAYNDTGGNCGGIVGDGGSNLSGDETCRFQLKTSLNKVDPKLAPLADNGGPTQTAALLTNSPAINAGNDSFSPSTDQRHASRSGTSDIGAFEINGTQPELILDAQLQMTNNIVFTWPASKAGFLLETTDSLLPQAIWSPLTNRSVVTGNQNTLTLSATNQNRYFRLRKP
jgi:hypothetical protein